MKKTRGVFEKVNLIVNGFYTGDVLSIIHSHGTSIGKILSYTLPHSIELIGLWLSGAIGFYIAKVIFDFMREITVLAVPALKLIGINASIAFIITLIAAFIEAYISIP